MIFALAQLSCQSDAIEAPVSVRRRALAEISPDAWDAFAQACESSIRCSHGFISSWALKSYGRYAVHLIEVFLARPGEPMKIGQTAVAVSRRRNIFLERLQLLPEFDHAWAEAMAAVLAEVGPGAYEYGGVNEIEPCRGNALRTVPGVTVSEVRPITVQYVDFSQWRTWDDYYRDISENSRRNARAADRSRPALRMSVRRGRQAVLSTLAMVHLRGLMSRRKQLTYSALRSYIRYVRVSLSCPRHTFSVVAKAGPRPLAFFYGADFGDHTYYLEGASVPENQGAAWRLMLDMLERVFRRAPSGKFVMGYVDYSIHDEAQSGGLLRSRRSCRVTGCSASLLQFSYQPA